jgi:aspartate/methionine/tyrosine aminotransferase
VTQRLWREAGVRVVPGRYLAQEQADGSNPGADYIRVAMVQNNEITVEAMHRLVAVLG